MKISRELALKILKYLLDNKDFYFPFRVMCKGYGTDQIFYEDNDYVEIILQEDYQNISEDSSYNDFELWENLQNINEETLQLMLKGFIDKIIGKTLIRDIENLANEYRKNWSIKICESVNIEEYGFNEFLGGKAEGFEDSLQIIKRYYKDINEG